MEFVKKKVNMDILSPFIASLIKKVKYTQTNFQQKLTIVCVCLSVFIYS